jgi:hypothetical protein
MKELIPMCLKLFHKMEREGMLPNSFYEARITPKQKPDKDTTNKRNVQTNFLDAKIHNKICTSQIQ